MIFDAPGRENTEAALKAAHERAVELGINEVVVASTTGSTGMKVVDLFTDFSVTVVTYHAGFRKPFETVMDEEMRQKLVERGAKVVQATHALSGVERAITKKFSGLPPVLMIAEVLRLFGHGTKVAVEIAVMAADAGALTGADILSIGGTGRGADSAVILKPACQSDFFDLRIREIICKPRNF